MCSSEAGLFAAGTLSAVSLRIGTKEREKGLIAPYLSPVNFRTVRVLHLFDFYLPATLSWVSRLLGHLPPAVEVAIGAPWIVQDAFCNPRFRYHRFPLQVPGVFDAVSEVQFPFWQRLLTRSQRFFPTYPPWLYRQLRQEPPDILHAHFGPTGCLYLPLAQKLGRPLVVTFYGFDYEKLLHHRPVFREKYRMLFAEAATVVVASPIWREKLVDMGCPVEKIALVRPSPDLAHFPVAQRAKPAGRLHLVQVATFTPKKGHLTTLEAVRLAREVCPDLHLTLAGERYDAALVREVEAFLQRHALGDCVTWLPPVRHDQMATFLAGFDAFIHPSQRTPDGDHEAGAVVLLEAQAVGLPVLATQHYDIPDQVAQGRTGLLVPEGDAPALADAIRQFYFMENATYQNCRANARQHVEGRYDVRESVRDLMAVYARLADAASRGFMEDKQAHS